MRTMVGMLKRLAVSVIVILPAVLALGVAAYLATASAQSAGVAQTAAGPKYPLVTLEIPPLINEIGAPTAILSSLQSTVIEEFRKKNLFAGVLPVTDVIDGVLIIRGTVLSWDASEAMGASGGGTLTVRLAIFQKIAPCPFNRATVKGVVSPAMLATGSIRSDHALVKGALDFLSSVTGDE